MKIAVESFYDDIREELDTFFYEKEVEIDEEVIDELTELVLKLIEDI